MKKTIQQKPATLAFHALGTLVLITGLAFSVIVSTSFATTYGIILVACYIVILALLASTYGAYFKKIALNKTQQYTINITSSLALFTLLLLAIGFIQDILDVSCSGLMGAKQSCIESWSFGIFYMLFQIPLLAFLIIALLFANSKK
jgi:hypothetical protein